MNEGVGSVLFNSDAYCENSASNIGNILTVEVKKIPVTAPSDTFAYQKIRITTPVVAREYISLCLIEALEMPEEFFREPKYEENPAHHLTARHCVCSVVIMSSMAPVDHVMPLTTCHDSDAALATAHNRSRIIWQHVASSNLASVIYLSEQKGRASAFK